MSNHEPNPGRPGACLRCGRPILWVNGEPCDRWLEYVQECPDGSVLILTEQGRTVRGERVDLASHVKGALSWGYEPHRCRSAA